MKKHVQNIEHCSLLHLHVVADFVAVSLLLTTMAVAQPTQQADPSPRMPPVLQNAPSKAAKVMKAPADRPQADRQQGDPSVRVPPLLPAPTTK
jgi:hypothetical protein